MKAKAKRWPMGRRPAGWLLVADDASRKGRLMELMEQNKNLVFGKAGSGMAYYMYHEMIRDYLRRGKRIVIDPKNERGLDNK